MMREIGDVARAVSNRYIEAWKEAGHKVVGFPCTFVPEEILHAAGILPFRLRGVGTKTLSIGDTYYGPVICSFPKCILQLAGQGDYSFLDGVIITNGCDSMRRLDECWRKAGEDIEGILPGFFYYFGVPHKVTDYSIEWFIEEIRELLGALEKHFETEITDQALHRSIEIYNNGRKLLRKLDSIRASEGISISGEDAMAIIIASSSMPREDFNTLAEMTLSHVKKSDAGMAGKKRLMIVGSANDDLDFIRLIEDSGALVVADTMCFGSKSYDDLVDEAGDPVEALARRYLSHSYCPRMFGYYKERLDYIRKKAAEVRVDGIILQNIRFCDLHGSENGIFERDLEKEGIPCMRMEREYGPLVETGRIKMRIDAFMERIG